jgi:cardiolipin synthase A/B
MPTNNVSSLIPMRDRATEWKCRLSMIREARSFLYLSTYYIEYDFYGTTLLEALLTAQRRGVSVTLLVDSFGQWLGAKLMSPESKAALASLVKELRDAGAVVTFYEPEGLLQRKLGGGQHIKIQVSEVGEAIFGSSNITHSSFDDWGEYSVALRGPIVRELLESYRSFGGVVLQSHLEQLEVAAKADIADIATDYWLCNPNLSGAWRLWSWQGENLVTQRLIEMLDQAQRSLWISSFYFKPTPSLLSAVIRAALRGVQVEVYHSHLDALPSTDLAWIGSAVGYPRLLAAGVKIYENHVGEHSKIVLVDDVWVAFGSYNFEDAAHDRLAEAMMSSRDRRAIEPVAAIFNELRYHPNNSLVTAEMLRALPLRRKARMAFYGPLKRWI